MIGADIVITVIVAADVVGEGGAIGGVVKLGGFLELLVDRSNVSGIVGGREGQRWQ